jgi:hypothetical protein
MWIFVGESKGEDLVLGHTEKSKHYLYVNCVRANSVLPFTVCLCTYRYTHWHYVFGYNNDKIVTANVSASIDDKYMMDITTHDPSHVVSSLAEAS